jgi:hypothetical protein
MNDITKIDETLNKPKLFPFELIAVHSVVISKYIPVRG